MKSNEDKVKISAAFLSDLKRAYDQESGIPPTFISDIKLVFEKEASIPRQISDDVALEELKRLGETLEVCREKCAQLVNEKISKLPDDHPILCPVSLFAPMDFGRLEVAHTRTLAWLLDPKKEHGFDDKLLKAMLEFVKTEGELSLTVNAVEAERFFRTLGDEDTGRTDVWVEGRWGEGESQPVGKAWLLVIEAKIDASEGSDQLRRYDKAIKEWSQGMKAEVQVHRVFLTPKGQEPSKEPSVAVSFSEVAIKFCNCYSSLKGKPGYDLLRYYIAGILHNILNKPTGRESLLGDPIFALSLLSNFVSGKGE